MLIGGSLFGTWMRMLFLDSWTQRFDAHYWSTNSWAQKFEAHPMHGTTHLQTKLKTKCSWLQTTFYNYGNCASQERVDWQWCITTTCKERKQKRTKVLVSGCKWCTKLLQQQFRVWNIWAMSIVDMWLFGDTLKGSKVLGGKSRLLVHQNLAIPSHRFTLLGNFNWKPTFFSFVVVAKV